MGQVPTRWVDGGPAGSAPAEIYREGGADERNDDNCRHDRDQDRFPQLAAGCDGAEVSGFRRRAGDAPVGDGARQRRDGAQPRGRDGGGGEGGGGAQAPAPPAPRCGAAWGSRTPATTSRSTAASTRRWVT